MLSTPDVFMIFAVLSAMGVVLTSRLMYSVLFLMLVFLSISALFISINAEYVGMVLFLVYVSAVIVFFLFIVMTSNFQDPASSKIKKLFFLSVLIAVTGLSCYQLIDDFTKALLEKEGQKTPQYIVDGSFHDASDANLTNMERIGRLLYTKYSRQVQMVGMILFISSVGTLLIAKKKNSRKIQ